MKLLLTLFTLAHLALFPVYSVEMNPTCVILEKSENQPAGQTSFTFINNCSEKMYINACVTAPSGEIKLYKSFRPIPPDGKFTFYTFPEVTADNIHWVAGVTDPGIPPACLLH